ncbi:undecaprenyl-diphosphatase UppP [Timonella senegalensis]|uniref:undecaprenyl-diphosphatase UppP n=1 Tax=Timonella senegalensis TaxID=1465825 RepID=UPI0028A76862|nr:undecaprenyl-diphosphatase UppP [Timonella senegalensis]
MNAFEAMFLGLIQGLTEFLPISSSAHLRIVGELMGNADPGAAFTAITQIGTETAVLLYFRNDIKNICIKWWQSLRGDHGTDFKSRMGAHDHDAKMAWYIGLGSIPIVVLGLLLESKIDTVFRNLYLTALMLAVFGLLLGWADKVGQHRKTLDKLDGKNAIVFGFAQAMALIPGVSRSGGTITAGLLMGYTREAAARYSFLLAIPAVMGSGFYKLYGAVTEPAAAGAPGMWPTFLATIVAFVVGYFVIIAFLKIVSTFSYKPFVIYRLFLAAAVVVLLIAGVLDVMGTASV